MLSPSWFHLHVTWPIAQNLAAGAIGAVALLIIPGAISFTGGCTPAALAEVTQGEVALDSDNMARASAIASDVIAQAPNCESCNAFVAAVSLKARRAAEKRQDFKSAEAARVGCYAHALKARTIFGRSSRVEALLVACKADNEFPAAR